MEIKEAQIVKRKTLKMFKRSFRKNYSSRSSIVEISAFLSTHCRNLNQMKNSVQYKWRYEYSNILLSGYYILIFFTANFNFKRFFKSSTKSRNYRKILFQELYLSLVSYNYHSCLKEFDCIKPKFGKSSLLSLILLSVSLKVI